jgi:hypothetical protein
LYNTPFFPPWWTDFTSHPVVRYYLLYTGRAIFAFSAFLTEGNFLSSFTIHVNRLCLEPGEWEMGYRKSVSFGGLLVMFFHDIRCAKQIEDLPMSDYSPGRKLFLGIRSKAFYDVLSINQHIDLYVVQQLLSTIPIHTFVFLLAVSATFPNSVVCFEQSRSADRQIADRLGGGNWLF